MAVSTKILLKFDGAAVKRGLAGVKQSFAAINKAGGKMFGNLMSGVAKYGTALAGLGGGLIFGKMIAGASETASNFEQMRLKFTMFTGSVEGAIKLMEQLRQVDVVSNLDLETLGKGAAKLMAFGVQVEDVSGMIEQLSKVSGGSADAFEGLTLAMGQTFSNKSLKGDDLRQYVERGWNPLEQITRKTGETMEQVRNRMEDHGVTMQEVKEALDAVTTGTGRFARAHELGSKTFMAATSRMKSQWAQLQDALGTPLNVHLGALFDRITAKIPQLTKDAKVLGDDIGKFLNASVNSVLTGDGSVFKAGFMSVASLIGEKLLAAFVLGGDIIRRSITEGFARTILGDEKVDRFKNANKGGSLTWNQASEMARGAFNSEGYANNFRQAVDRNQGVPVDEIKPKELPYGQAAEYMRQAVEELKGVNRKLSPQP